MGGNQSMALDTSSVPTPEAPKEPMQAESAVDPQTHLQETLKQVAVLEADLQESLKVGATSLEMACELESRAGKNSLQPTKLEAAPSNSPEEKSQPSLKPLGERKDLATPSKEFLAREAESLAVGPEHWDRLSEQEVLDRRGAAPNTPLGQDPIPPASAMDIVRSPVQTPPPSPPEWSGSPVSPVQTEETTEVGQTSQTPTAQL